MRLTPRTWRLVPVAVLLLCASGCSYTYHFDLALKVVNDQDGSPLADVRVTLEFHADTRAGDLPRTTDQAGRFVHHFWVSITDFDDHNQHRRWWVKLEKDGFAPELIDIKPAARPAKYGSTTPLDVTVRLKPL